MSISTIIKASSIEVNVSGQTKQDIYDMLVELHVKNGNIIDKDKFASDISSREAQGNTSVGEGVCIPHAKSDSVINAGLTLVITKDGVNTDSIDGKDCNLFFMIAAPKDSDFHLDTLSNLMRLIMNENFRSALINAKTSEEAMEVIQSAEREKEMDGDATQSVDEQSNLKSKKQVYILAVTACPTGIAHTYMAAESLENKAKQMGVTLKAETNGSGGAKNILTDDEIARADAIIIAADTNVKMDRFDKKPLIKVKVSDGIRRAEQLIQQCIDGKVSIYSHSGEIDVDNKDKKESLGRQLYKHLMSGVSHMLPFVIGGGILIALSFLIDRLAGGAQDSNFGSNTPVAAWFNTIGGIAFSFMLPVLAGYIAYSIADRPGMVVGFVGGAMAVVGVTFTKLTETEGVTSGFLGALIAGFAAGYLTLALKKGCDVLPRPLEGIKPVLIYPLIGCLLIAVFMSAINPLMGLINTGISNGLNSLGNEAKIGLGILLGGMMAIDMGGPINKAAYVFGTASIATGNYDVMAAVMVGGMVPPIAIALATTFFKSKFTVNERKAGPVNYIMGLCFITEGAIPYAASDPARVIPSCVVGSAVAGGLSMAFNATLQAPHGGIFVFAVVGNWYLYLLALAIGSVVGMLMLALLKKKKIEQLEQKTL